MITDMGWLMITVISGFITGLAVVPVVSIPPFRRAARRRRWTRLLAVALGLLVWVPFCLYRGYVDAAFTVYGSGYLVGRPCEDGKIVYLDCEIHDKRGAVARELWRRRVVPQSLLPCRAAGDICRLVDRVESDQILATGRAWPAEILVFDLASALAGSATAWLLVRPGAVTRRRSRHREVAGVFLRLFLASIWLIWVILFLSLPLIVTVQIIVYESTGIAVDGFATVSVDTSISIWEALWPTAIPAAVGVAALVGLVVTGLLAWRAGRAARSAGG